MGVKIPTGARKIKASWQLLNHPLTNHSFTVERGKRGLRANQRETWNDRRLEHARNEPIMSYSNVSFQEAISCISHPQLLYFIEEIHPLIIEKFLF